MVQHISRYKALLPTCAGLLLCLTLPPVDAGFVVWIALVPLLLYIHATKSLKRAFFAGMLTGTICGVKVLYPLSTLNAWWWTNPAGIFWDVRTGVLTLLLIFVASYSGGLVIGLFSVAFKKFRQIPLVNILLFSALWTLFERAREPLVLGFTWGHLGYALHNSLYLVQIAKLGFVYSVTFLILAVNIGIFETILAIYTYYCTHKHRGIRESILHGFLTPAFLSIFALIIASFMFGYISLQKTKGDKHVLQVAAVHMDIKTEDSVGIEAFNAYLALIDEALTRSPDLIVLPENAFPFFVINEETRVPLKYENTASNIKDLFNALRQRSIQHPSTSFIIGMHSVLGDALHNSMVVLEKGDIADIYNKRKLMPFAEDDTKIFGGSKTKPFLEGVHDQIIHAHGSAITPLICSEIIFPSLSYNRSSNLIINASNDSVFSSRLVGIQNHAIAQIRAIENNKYVIRSVKGGITSIIDPFGRILAKKEGGRGVIIASITY